VCVCVLAHFVMTCVTFLDDRHLE